MPQGLVTVYFTETGDAIAMHPIDAAEAMATGLYSLEAPTPKAAPTPARATPTATPAPTPPPEPMAGAARRTQG